DQISDSILDSVMEQDPTGRVACETLVSTGVAFIAGEITTSCYVDFARIVRETIREVGYTRAKFGFDCDTCAVISSVQEQSPDIAIGVDTGGAGDQGMMFGYACRETEELMPMPIMMAHKLVRKVSELRRSGVLEWARPDGKSQVSVEYEADKPVRIDTIVMSIQHDAKVEQAKIAADLKDHVVSKVVPADLLDSRTKFYFNPTGRFEIGGPHGDTGLTGRKIIVDTYGGMAAHGGGCFSGKDPTKVDRSASYMARFVAKNLVAAGLCERVQIQFAYAIGVADPVSVNVNTFGTGRLPEQKLVELVREHFPLTPKGIIETLNLRRPIFKKTAAFGHFGRTEPEFTWENTEKAAELKKAL
ncbi:MAG TPA: methionine adenosyltransferase, partial [Acidobacteriota bacterium]